MDESVRVFHQGAMWSGTLSYVGIFSGIIGFIGMTACYQNGQALLAFLAFLVCAVGVGLAPTVRGVVVNRKHQTVTPYLRVLGIRMGTAVPMSHFEAVEMKRVREQRRSSSFSARGGSGVFNTGYTYSSWFEVQLRITGGKRYFLEDHVSENLASGRLEEIAAWMDLPAVNLHQQQVEALQKRRAQVDPRSRRR